MKKCSHCKLEKDYSEYHKNKSQSDGYKNQCKLCVKLGNAKNKETKNKYNKQYYQDNKDKIAKTNKKYRQGNKDKIAEYNKEYQQDNKDKILLKRKEWEILNQDNIIEYQKEWRKNNKEETLIYAKEYRKNNRDKINQYYKDRWGNDPLFKLSQNTRNLIRHSFKTINHKKTSKTTDILGCSFEEFKLYLESKWEPWMSWENKGNPKDGIIEPNKTWDIDHIVRLSTAETEEDVIRLNHYTNLQPLCSYHNRFIKG